MSARLEFAIGLLVLVLALAAGVIAEPPAEAPVGMAHVVQTAVER